MSFDGAFFKKFPAYLVSEVEEGFYHVQFNNPKVLNAFSEQEWIDYEEILLKLDSLEETKVILISSNVPKAFSSGLNLKTALEGFSSTGTPEQKVKDLKQHIVDFQRCIGTPAKITTPTICLMNGISYGLALDIASACTIRIATEDVKLSIREIKIGIVADIGSLQRFPNVIGNSSFLNHMALTGDVFGAQQALQIGIISKIVPDLKTGIDYAKEVGESINSNPKWAVRGTKDNIQYIVNGASVESGLAKVADYNSVHISGNLGGVKL